MDVWGQLVKADLENLSSDPSATTGRLYLNTTSHVAKLYANAAWHTLMDLDTAQTATNKTFTSPVLNGSLTGTGIKDEDDMVSDSATAVPTQQSVKAYVDSIVSAGASVHTVTDANYTGLDADGYTTVLFDTGASNRTYTPPAAANNDNRLIKIVKMNSDAGYVTVDLSTDVVLRMSGMSVDIQSDGTTWHVVSSQLNSNWTSYTPTFSGLGTCSGISFAYRLIGEMLEVRGEFTSGTTTANIAEIRLPTGYDVTNQATSSTQFVGMMLADRTGARPQVTILATNTDNFVTTGELIANSNSNATAEALGSTTVNSLTRMTLAFSVRIA